MDIYIPILKRCQQLKKRLEQYAFRTLDARLLQNQWQAIARRAGWPAPQI